VVSVEVTWKCYNATQLNFLREHFLLAGRYVIVDFGHIISNRTNTEPLRPFDFAAPDAVIKLAQYENKGRLAVVDGEGELDDLVQQNGGNYDMFIGKVIDSNVSLQADNTYECKTVIVSTGEVIYGATHHSLIADLAKTLTEEEKDEYISTIQEFFESGGQMDAEIGMAAARAADDNNQEAGLDAAGQPAIIDAYRKKRTAKGTVLAFGPTRAPVVVPTTKVHADEFVYVSWNFFTHTIIPSMFAVLTAQPINSEIDLFTSIGQPVYDKANNQKVGESLIGNHPSLTSVDYETLIIVKESSLDEDAAENKDESVLFEGAKVFSAPNESNEEDEKNGYLSRGVYLNVETIREAFVNQRTFYDGMAALLRKMNNATANYWKLDIGYDEESKKVYIFDNGSVLPGFPTAPPRYTFNKGVEGELLEMNFDVAYTDEVKTSIMISGRTHGEQDFGVFKPASEYSATFGPDRHGLILNTDTLIDVVQEEINKQAATRRRERLALLGKTPADVHAQSLAARQVARSRETEAEARDREEQEDETGEVIRALRKYDSRIKHYFQLPSTMKGTITKDGLRNSDRPNNYLSPLATEITLQLTVMGISGVAFWDCFMVDKIPKVYAKHGFFLVNGLSHNIGREGWVTSINGLYYFIWRDEGQGERHTDTEDPSSDVSTPVGITTFSQEEKKRRQSILDRGSQGSWLERFGRARILGGVTGP